MVIKESQKQHQEVLLQQLCSQVLSGKHGFICFRSSSKIAASEFTDTILARELAAFQVFGSSLLQAPYQAYYPFLNWLSAVNPQHSPKLLRKVYPQHKALLSNLFDGKPLSRDEELLVQESDYEQDCMLNNICTMLESLCKHHCHAIYIRNAQFLPESSLSLLREINHRKIPGLLIICSFSSIIETLSTTSAEHWKMLFSELDKSGGLVYQSIKTDSTHNILPHVHHEICSARPDEAIKAFYLLAFHDCIECIESIETCPDTCFIERMNPEYRCCLIWAQGMSLYYLHKHREAIVTLHRYLALSRQHKLKRHVCRAYRCMALAYIAQNNIDAALSMHAMAASMNDEQKDSLQSFYLDFTELLIENKKREQRPDTFRSFFYDVLQKAQKLNAMNTATWIAITPCNLQSDYQIEEQATHDEAIQTASILKNQYLLAAAYQSRGAVYAAKGDYNKVILNYRKSLQIRKKLKSKQELCYIYNGLGFYYLMTGEHQKSSNILNTALRLLQDYEDCHETAITLLNLGTNSLLAGDYQHALTCFDLCRKLSDAQGNWNLTYHSYYGIYCMTGITCLRTGQPVRAWQILVDLNSQGLTPLPDKHEEKFYYAVFRALLSAANSDPENCCRYFLAAEEHIHQSAEFIEYLLPWMRIEKDAAMSHYNEVHNTDVIELSSHIKRTPPLSHISLSWINRRIANQQQIRSMHEQLEEIRCVELLHAVRQRCIDEKDFIKAAVDILHSSLFLTSVYYFVCEKNQKKMLYSKTSTIAYPETLHSIAETLFCLPHHTLLHSYSKPPIPREFNLQWAYILRITIPSGDTNHLACLVLGGNHKTRPPAQKGQILSLVKKTIEDSLLSLMQTERILKQRQALDHKEVLLQQLSLIDSLTGLSNRSALYEQLHIHAEPSNVSDPILLLCIELDNIQGFNEKHGHVAGDTVLKKSAHIIEACCRDSDSAFRYDGNRFIVIMPKASADGGIKLASRVDSALNRLFSTYDEPRLACCSIGICSSAYKEYDPGDLLSKAEQAADIARKTGEITVIT